jgi:AcrR family transcriptional regulator
MRRSPTLDLEAVLADLFRPAARVVTDPAVSDPAGDAALAAAGALLGERGIRGWTVEDVAERAGLGRATVYRRFASRDELVRAALTRDARRFFRVVARSVASVEPLEDQVVHGFLVGLRLVQASPLAGLLRSDPAAAMSLLGSQSLMSAAAGALADRYEAMTGAALSPSERNQAEAVAEGLVRLGLSFVLVPGPAVERDDDPRALDHIGAIIRPLLAGRSAPRR